MFNADRAGIVCSDRISGSITISFCRQAGTSGVLRFCRPSVINARFPKTPLTKPGRPADTSRPNLAGHTRCVRACLECSYCVSGFTPYSPVHWSPVRPPRRRFPHGSFAPCTAARVASRRAQLRCGAGHGFLASGEGLISRVIRHPTRRRNRPSARHSRLWVVVGCEAMKQPARPRTRVRDRQPCRANNPRANCLVATVPYLFRCSRWSMDLAYIARYYSMRRHLLPSIACPGTIAELLFPTNFLFN